MFFTYCKDIAQQNAYLTVATVVPNQLLFRDGMVMWSCIMCNVEVIPIYFVKLSFKEKNSKSPMIPFHSCCMTYLSNKCLSTLFNLAGDHLGGSIFC